MILNNHQLKAVLDCLVSSKFTIPFLEEEQTILRNSLRVTSKEMRDEWWSFYNDFPFHLKDILNPTIGLESLSCGITQIGNRMVFFTKTNYVSDTGYLGEGLSVKSQYDLGPVVWISASPEGLLEYNFPSIEENMFKPWEGSL